MIKKRYFLVISYIKTARLFLKMITSIIDIDIEATYYHSLKELHKNK
ncbi:MAG: hypothetical protein PHU60_06460 [Tissierellia bacterium]|nr:hypothetical protein [Tissierellia bacterium]MDD3751673.1 hypothetical protein [Tissierellia bacterium]